MERTTAACVLNRVREPEQELPADRRKERRDRGAQARRQHGTHGRCSRKPDLIDGWSWGGDGGLARAERAEARGWRDVLRLSLLLTLLRAQAKLTGSLSSQLHV